MTHIEQLQQLHACSEAVDCRNFTSLQDAWNACQRGDWMLWLVGKTIAGAPWSEQRRRLVCAAADCAALAPAILDQGAELARQWAIDATRRWGQGEDNQDEVIAGRTAADAAAYAASYAAYAASYASYAAYAASYAAYAASYAAYAAATTAAYAASYAAYAAATAAARKQVLADCAVIVRSYYPECPI